MWNVPTSLWDLSTSACKNTWGTTVLGWGLSVGQCPGNHSGHLPGHHSGHLPSSRYSSIAPFGDSMLHRREGLYLKYSKLSLILLLYGKAPFPYSVWQGPGPSNAQKSSTFLVAFSLNALGRICILKEEQHTWTADVLSVLGFQSSAITGRNSIHYTLTWRLNYKRPKKWH